MWYTLGMNIYCPNCENGCSDAVKACPKCGHPFVEINQQSIAQPPPFPPQSQPSPKSSLGKKILYVVLFLMLMGIILPDSSDKKTPAKRTSPEPHVKRWKETEEEKKCAIVAQHVSEIGWVMTVLCEKETTNEEILRFVYPYKRKARSNGRRIVWAGFWTDKNLVPSQIPNFDHPMSSEQLNARVAYYQINRSTGYENFITNRNPKPGLSSEFTEIHIGTHGNSNNKDIWKNVWDTKVKSTALNEVPKVEAEVADSCDDVACYDGYACVEGECVLDHETPTGYVPQGD